MTDRLHAFPMPAKLVDQFGRRKRKLRVSLTDRCNFRCRYCMPERPQWQARQLHLDNAELARLLRLLVDQGIEQLRLTGGEPLLRADLLPLLEDLQALRALGLQRISMTSNASRLARQAKALAAAGLDDLNISLDCLDPALFRCLTGQPIAPVLAGIEAARAAGLPVKINAVLVRGYNETAILPLLDWAMREDLELRFIEYMPLDAPGRWQPESVFSEDELVAEIATAHQIERLPWHTGPATPWQVDGYYRLGLISTISKPFCASCDRLRITADGTLYTCLFSSHGTALKPWLRAPGGEAELSRQLQQAVWNKPSGYAADPRPVERPLLMYAMGG